MQSLVISLRLPFPPSTNRLWRHQGGQHHKSDRYKTWAVVAQQEIMRQLSGIRRPIFGGKVRVEIQVSRIRGWRGPRPDLDNLAKAVLDQCEAMAVITDDRNVDDLRIRWADVDGAHVTVAAA